MPLVNTGLVCRYFFDEAASGTGPSQVTDHSANAYHLTTINYGAGNMAYTEISGNRGLESTSTTGSQRCVRAVDNVSDALRDAFAGIQKATMEVVVRADAFNASGGRVFGINDRNGSSGTFMLRGTSLTNWQFYWEDTAFDSFSLNDGLRHVIHIVVDTTIAVANEKIKVYVDDVAHSTTENVGITLNDTLTIPSDVDLIAFNRESGGSFDRSMDGVGFYGALYTGAMSASDRTNNYDILTADDDAPAVASLLWRPRPIDHMVIR